MVAIVGDDLACEVVARTLSAAGVGSLRLIRRAAGALPPEVTRALLASNPEVMIETRALPSVRPEGQTQGRPAFRADESGLAWLEAIAGATVVVRSGFDDDPMLPAAVRAGVPVVVMRGREDGIDVVSFRRHGPCPHRPLDVPEKSALPPEDGAPAVVAAHLAAAEVLILLAGAAVGAGRARHVSIPASGGAHSGVGGEHQNGREVPRSVEIPWSPECFACGGSGTEMAFS
jgi:hypothetical protein